MTEFIFIRHGQTDENKKKHIQGRRDIPLNECGMSQALLCGEFLKRNGYTFDVIYSSPLSRAVKTAEIINDVCNTGLDIIKSEGFIERSFGVKEGCDVCHEVFKEINDDSAEGLEKSYEVQKRVLDELYRVAKLYDGKRVLVTTHSHTIKAITTYCDPDKYHFEDRLSNCALSIFNVDKDKVMVKDFNIETQN
ncbi:MAG: histidine phosphatase family protein [Acholeplasmatales bacterium]|nr:histidine phosphatase family protein [Acholeplasmatales bacterium]